MEGLILVGYWHSKDRPDLPDPAWFIDEQWDADTRQRVIDYLKNGKVVRRYMGFSWCRFRCGNGRHNGTNDCSDGVYGWPSGLAHYLKDHAVRLPDEFVTHALTGLEVPAWVDSASMRQKANNATWWCAQRGWRDGNSFRTYVDYGED